MGARGGPMVSAAMSDDDEPTPEEIADTVARLPVTPRQWAADVRERVEQKQRKVIDLNPVLRVRRQSACEHSSVLVDETLADLECEACGKQLNPYWWIAGLAAQWNEHTQRIVDHEAKMLEQHKQNIAMMNHRAERLRLEIETLEAKKRQLMAESVGGQPLGRQVKRWRRPR